MSVSNFSFYKPKMLGKTFDFFHKQIKLIADDALLDANKTGRAKYPLVVFNEVYLKYLFTIEQTEVMREVERAQKSLPSDLWMGIAFSVFELDSKIGPRNVGHIFSKTEHSVSPKKICTDFDKSAIVSFYEHSCCTIKSKWYIDDKNDIIDETSEFAKINAPDNLLAEVRVCFDVTALPIKNEPNTFTLVPAFQLDFLDVKALPKNRLFMVINDFHPVWDYSFYSSNVH